MIPLPFDASHIVYVAIFVAALIAACLILCLIRTDCECLDGCDYLQIAVMGSIGAFLVALWLGGCCGLWWWGVVGGLLLTSLGIYAAWVSLCNPSRCTILGALAIAVDSIAVTIIGYLDKIPVFDACDRDLLQWSIAVAGVLLTVALARCKATTEAEPIDEADM
jgi:hypothetical protein